MKRLLLLALLLPALALATVNGSTRAVVILPSADGVRYGSNPNGLAAVSGAVQVALEASGWGQSIGAGGTITCPAPCAVFFDSTATTHTDNGINVFRELGYHFDFGYATPTTPGSWTVSGQPKGNEIGGPLAAHVYETAGTYTASVRAQDANGIHDDATVTIVVQDPDTYWTTGGRSTVHHTDTTRLPTWASNTRYQFDKASTYVVGAGSGNINEKTNILIEAVGAGAKPILPALTIESSTTTTRAWSSNIVLNGIQTQLTLAMPSSYILAANCTFTDNLHMDQGTEAKFTSAGSPAGWYSPKFITFYQVDGTVSAGQYPLFGAASRLAILGSSFHGAVFHDIRLTGWYKALIAHSTAYASGSSSENVTFRSRGTSTDYSGWDSWTATRASRYGVMTYSTIGSAADTSGLSAVTVKPASDTFSEGIEDVLVINSGENRASGGGLAFTGRRCAEIDNTFTAYSGDTTQGAAATPAEWFGPYYSNNLTPVVGLVLAMPARIVPDKAGTP
jgi:hypothetical protein